MNLFVSFRLDVPENPVYDSIMAFWNLDDEILFTDPNGEYLLNFPSYMWKWVITLTFK